MASIIFITGTDTGVGKTVLAALLVMHLQDRGENVIAAKPFCAGGRQDAHVLRRAMRAAVPIEEVNPFYFPEPLAPLVAARRRGRAVKLTEAVSRIKSLAAQCDHLILEGAGGLLVPIARGKTILDLIRALPCRLVLVVARNRLGTLNHTLMTAGFLRQDYHGAMKVVLMNRGRRDLTSGSNAAILREWLGPAPVEEMPNLGPNPTVMRHLQGNCRKLKKVLARILE